MKEILKVMALGLIITFSLNGCSAKEEVKVKQSNSYELQNAHATQAQEALESTEYQ